MTPNMNLALPTVSLTQGPDWATQLNAVLAQVDVHNHTTGQGVPVPSRGINVNDTLSFNGYDATMLRTVRFSDQTSPLTAPTDAGCVYRAGGNLFFNSGAGVAVQITAGAALAGTPGSIGGLASPAAVTYTSINTTFRFTSNTNVNAAIDVGQVLIRQPIASANAVTLQSPNSLAANYAITLPTALPAAQRIVTLDNLGVMNYWNIDGTTVVNNAGVLGVIGALAITTNTGIALRGNRSAADAGADVVSNGAVTRTAGLIHDFQNNGVSKLSVGFDGSLTFGALNVSPRIVSTLSTGIGVMIQGNVKLGDNAPDVVSNGSVTRSQGIIHDFQNNGVSKASVGFDGTFYGTNVNQIVFNAGQLTTSSTFANWTGVAFSMAASSSYEVDLTINYMIDVTATDLLVRLTLTTGSSSIFLTATNINDVGAITASNMSVVNTSTSNNAVGAAGVTILVVSQLHIRGLVVNGSGSAGTAQFQIASSVNGRRALIVNAVLKTRRV